MKRFIEDLFCKTEREEKLSDRIFMTRIWFSVGIIVACLAAMGITAFAFFSGNVTSSSNVIQSASYTISVSGTAEDGTYLCPLISGDIHQFTLTASGTANTGYCKIKIGEQIYHTAQMAPGESITLTIVAGYGARITFIPQWGTSALAASGQMSDVYEDREIISHSNTSYIAHTVQYGETFTSISNHYGVPVEAIKVYNDTEELVPGSELLIPHPILFSQPAAPQETSPVETAPIETAPPETKPIEPKPVETKPAVTKPAETKPTVTKPVETKPVVTTPPIETEPANTEPIVTTPTETDPPEIQPTETEPTEIKPIETEPTEIKPIETEPVENKPAETNPPVIDAPETTAP